MKDIIGSGSSSSVYLIQRYQKKFALKKCREEVRSPNLIDIFRREVAIMSQLYHPNITKLQEVEEDGHALILQFAQQGSLAERLRQHHHLSQIQSVPIVREVLLALRYLQRLQPPVLHRDVKPQNILLSGGHIKLIDFGSANYLRGERRSYAGTPQYMAPQIDLKQQQTLSSDLWLVGALIHQLLTGFVPSDPLKLSKYQLSNQAVSIISMLLRKNQKQRPQIDDVLKHNWFNIDRKQEEKQVKNCQKQKQIKSIQIRYKQMLIKRQQQQQTMPNKKWEQDYIGSVYNRVSEQFEKSNELANQIDSYKIKEINEQIEMYRRATEQMQKLPLTNESKCIEQMQELKRGFEQLQLKMSKFINEPSFHLKSQIEQIQSDQHDPQLDKLREESLQRRLYVLELMQSAKFNVDQ